MVLSAHEASAAPTRSVGEKLEPSPPLSFGGMVRICTPDGSWVSWHSSPVMRTFIGTPMGSLPVLQVRVKWLRSRASTIAGPSSGMSFSSRQRTISSGSQR